MTLFDTVRARMTETPDEKHTPILIVLPLAGKEQVATVTTLPSVRFHDDQGVVEIIDSSGSKYHHITDIKQISIIFVSGNLGDHIASRLPKAWTEMSDESRQQLNKVDL